MWRTYAAHTGISGTLIVKGNEQKELVCDLAVVTFGKLDNRGQIEQKKKTTYTVGCRMDGKS